VKIWKWFFLSPTITAFSCTCWQNLMPNQFWYQFSSFINVVDKILKWWVIFYICNWWSRYGLVHCSELFLPQVQLLDFPRLVSLIVYLMVALHAVLWFISGKLSWHFNTLFCSCTYNLYMFVRFNGVHLMR